MLFAWANQAVGAVWRLCAAIRRLLANVPSGVRPGYDRFFLVINFATLISGVGHLSFIPLFAFLRIPSLVYYNMGSVMLFLIAWSINRRGYHYLSLLLSIAEFTGHAWLAVKLLGWDFGFQYYMIGWCFVPFLAPKGGLWLKYGIFIFNSAGFITLCSYAGASPLAPDAWQLHFAKPLNAFNFVFFCSGFAFAFFYFRNLVDEAEAMAKSAFDRSEWLLHNILPATIAERLKLDASVIAEAHPSATVLFLDIANFTPLSQTMPPEKLVHMLNTIFSRLDALTDKHGVEKIKTIGDAYMVAAGVPVAQPDHAERIARFALDAFEAVHGFTDHQGNSLKARIGIDTGPVVAGVIGVRKFIYDMWGDMVNTASRMESHGLPDHIQTTREFYTAARHAFVFEPRGIVSVKGKGDIETYFLTGCVKAPGLVES